MLKGTARTDRHGDAPPGNGLPNAPAARAKFPRPPKDALGPVGLREWRFVRKQLEASGIIKPIHHAVLLGYCLLYEQMATKRESMTGSLWAQLRMYAVELCLTPPSSERQRRTPPRE